VFLDRFGRGVESAHFTVAFLAGTGLPALGIVAAMTTVRSETARLVRLDVGNAPATRDLARSGIAHAAVHGAAVSLVQRLSTRVPASRAALIYLLEPVFASLFSLLWGHDTLALPLLVGGSLILAGNALVEVPDWFRNTKRADVRASEKP